MSALAKQQQALLSLLFDWPNDDASKNIATYVDNTWARGQKVYQANGHAMACNALRAAYPVLAQLVGDEGFDDLACALWHANPPLRGDAAQWGGTLATFVRASDQLATEPYLPDVAALEWALHCASNAADGQADPNSFALLSTHAPLDVMLVLSPGCVVQHSAWPVVSIVNAHLHQTPSLRAAGKMVQSGVSEVALVWRQGLHTRLREAWPAEPVFVTEVLNDRTLGHALDQAPGLDIGAWLPMAVQTGLLQGVRLAPLAIQAAGHSACQTMAGACE